MLPASVFTAAILNVSCTPTPSIDDFNKKEQSQQMVLEKRKILQLAL